MNLFARRSMSRLKFFVILAVLASAFVAFLMFLYSSEIIDLMTRIYAAIVLFLALLFITAVYAYFEAKRKTSGFLRSCMYANE